MPSRKAWSRRYEAIRSGKVKPWEDNALAITTDGRKLALDARLLSPHAEDFPGSKINALVAERLCHMAGHPRFPRDAVDFLRYGRQPHRVGL